MNAQNLFVVLLMKVLNPIKNSSQANDCTEFYHNAYDFVMFL